MNPPSHRSTYKNDIDKKPVDLTITTKTKCKPEPKSITVAYDYKAAISQPDIPAYLKVDSNTQNSCSNLYDESPTPISKKKNTRRKRSVTTRKKGIGPKASLQTKKVTKKITKFCSKICDDAKVEKEPIFLPKITRGVKNFGTEKDIIIENHETSSDHFQSENVQETLKVAEDIKNLSSEIVHIQEIKNLHKEENSGEIDRNIKSRILQNKNTKLPVESKFTRTDMKPFICGEDKKIESNKSSNMTKTKDSDMVGCYKEAKSTDALQINHRNLMSANVWHEKSSEMDTNKELESDLPTTMSESQITTADDPRSATLLKSLTLKCACRSCNEHKHTSTIHRSSRHTESDFYSSPRMEDTKRWPKRSMKYREFTDIDSEDLLSDYSVDKNIKINARNNKISSNVNHITKSCLINNSSGMRTYQPASFSFFNVFFDIVFWPFIFLRDKQ